MLDHDSVSPQLKAFLVHWGVKGMRWGVRKDNRKSGRSSKGATQTKKVAPPVEDRRSDDVKTLPPSFKPNQNTDKLSDEEFKRVLARMRMEKEFKDLTKNEVAKSNEWVAAVRKGMLSSVTGVTAAAMNSYMKKRLKGTPFEY